VLRLFNAVDDVLIQSFVPDGAVVALDVGVLLGLSRQNVRQGDTLLFSPIQQCLTVIFRAITPSE
jgi:hypothetical protein